MEIDDLKSSWQESGGKPISPEQVKQMTKINQHPVLKKIRFKLLFEALLLCALLLVYYDGFDGDKKPFVVNLLLVICIVIYISNNVLGYLSLRNPVKADNLVLSIQTHISILKKLSVFSLLSSMLYAGSLLLFFASSIAFTQQKYTLIAALVIFTVGMFFFSIRSWKNKIQRFQKLLDEFH